MPFKSEAQRRYLWANEPEIARDWTDTYGSRIQKSNGGITQAGAINYEPSEMVSVPKEFRARAHSPNTHLAYITDDEAGILQALKPDTPHKGPRGIPNYDSFDASGAYSNPDTGYSASSGGAGGGWQDSSKQDEKIRQKWEQASDQQKQTWDPASEQRKLKYGLTDDDEKKDPPTPEDKKDGWQIPSLWSPKTHYSMALNLPGAKKSRLASIKAYKEYLDSQGVDSSWIDLEDIGYEQWQEMKKFQPPTHRVDPMLAGNLGINPDYFPMDYKNFMLTHEKKPGMFVSGDVGNFWNQPNPKGAINPDTGMPFTNTEWETFKRGVIQDRGYSTGNDNYGGVPGAVPFGDMPLWQQQGFNSYEDWLATQGGGATLPGFDVDSPKNTVAAKTAFPYASYGTAGYPTSSIFQSYLARGGRVPAAFGGIMDTNTGRRAYGLGSIFKSVKKAAKKVLKSPLGKAAILGLGAYGANAGWFGKGMSGWVGGLKSMAQDKKWLGNLLLNEAGGFSPWKLAGIGMTAAPFLGIGTKAKQDTLSGMADRGGGLIDPITGKEAKPAEMRASLNDALSAAWNEDKQAYESEAMAAIKQAYPFLGQYPIYKVKDGGRIGAQEGGLMDLGGMEKDYRNNGGFVAIGGEERADDVPARLSRNEFVFTADAVRGAGGGDIDKGAEIMENVMKNLEQGGKISQETQGNTGAQEMFSVSERIGEVL